MEFRSFGMDVFVLYEGMDHLDQDEGEESEMQNEEEHIGIPRNESPDDSECADEDESEEGIAGGGE